MDLIINIAVFLIAAVIFTFVGMFLRKKTAEAKLKGAENEAQRIIEMANKEAENKKKEEEKRTNIKIVDNIKKYIENQEDDKYLKIMKEEAKYKYKKKELCKKKKT